MVDSNALAFEDLSIGQTWLSDARTIQQRDIFGFANLTGDHTPIHVDPEFAANTPFRQIIAHGLLGLSILAGLSSEHPKVRTTALVDVKAWKFVKPIMVGDQVKVETEVIDLMPHGRRHGEVHWNRKLINQHGEVVQHGILITLVEARHATKKNGSSRVDAVPSKTVSEPKLLQTTSQLSNR